jgi:membrane protease YdiL (CAAX protease family)
MRSLVKFFLLTYIISWGLFIIAAIISRNSKSLDSGFSPVGYFIYLIGVFAPALVAVFLSWREKRKAGVRALLSKIFKAPTYLGWYIFAIGYFATIKLFAAVVYRIANGRWPLFGHEAFYIIAAGIIFSTPMQAGEEIGWRGFALPRMANRFGVAAASLILGIIWAAWHLPFFFMQGVDKFGQSFPVYLLSVVAISVAMAWLYWRTEGSLLLTMLMHSAINNTTDIVPSTVAGAVNPFSMNASPIAWITTALMWLVTFYFLIQMRGVKIAETR